MYCSKEKNDNEDYFEKGKDCFQKSLEKWYGKFEVFSQTTSSFRTYRKFGGSDLNLLLPVMRRIAAREAPRLQQVIFPRKQKPIANLISQELVMVKTGVVMSTF
mmetsp:Transcript_24582/g.37378  ORF Transcript_24582/g.37378 Transcript_24582/m.37378 type:complete len:104 (-) Transcript_24582:1170-1481(-)